MKITKISYLYALCSLYVLSSSVFADYHLIIFFAPLILLSLNEEKIDNTPMIQKIIFIGSIAQLIPKNFIYHHDISAQVFLNPLILIASLFLILFESKSLRIKNYFS